jgi:hypothetical protein
MNEAGTGNTRQGWPTEVGFAGQAEGEQVRNQVRIANEELAG